MDYSDLSRGGAHVLVDGQFGSTGKGLFASYIAERAAATGVTFFANISNAGPNSGHTFYHEGKKVVLKQLPSFAVKQCLMGVEHLPLVYLSAGAIIDPKILAAEAAQYPDLQIFVNPQAAVIRSEDKEAERQGSIAAVAGTRSGTGAALARKIERHPDAIVRNVHQDYKMPSNVFIRELPPDFVARYRCFVEVSQGFSLGVHSSFYPKVTSRECTVMQAIADARIAPQLVSNVYMVARTFPIRVGNVDGFSSGEFYPDQVETNWDDLGVTPERTTVTNRVRRVFTFSEMQMLEAIYANRPDFILLNFMNYLTKQGQKDIMRKMDVIRAETMVNFRILTGFGPENKDVVPF